MSAEAPVNDDDVETPVPDEEEERNDNDPPTTQDTDDMDDTNDDNDTDQPGDDETTDPPEEQQQQLTEDAVESNENNAEEEDDDDEELYKGPTVNGEAAATKQQEDDSDLKEEGEEIEETEVTSDEPMEDTTPTTAPAATAATEAQQPQYSTRGRHHSKESDVDILSRGAPEEEEVHRPVGASFLDSLGEDERRTRTRFLPDVDGIHILHKSEIKQDLQLARTVMSSAGVSSKLTATQKANNNDTADDADMQDDDDLVAPSEDERLSTDLPGSSSGYTAMLDQSAAIPTRAFSVPPEEDLKNSPHVVESVTAFNPPRPPESVGPKKKHRMMRWERQPLDVEGDLNSYRKTVTRTRKELIDAQSERERMDSVSAHLRSHFLNQLTALDQEGGLLNDELGTVQLDCVKAADLLQSRTRSRGVGKGSYVMRDVLTILKQKGAEVANFPVKDNSVTEEQVTVGIGGIPAKAMMDWERGHKVEPAKPASAWILPGQIVQTQYGKGEVLHVFGPVELNVGEAPLEGSTLNPKPPKPAQHGFGSAEAKETKTNGDAKGAAGKDGKGIEKKTSKKKNKNKKEETDKEPSPLVKVDALLAARACVKLPFGIGFFPLGAISAQDHVSSYSDAMLASRWKKMAETAVSVAGCVDHAAMANFGGTIAKDASSMNDVDDAVPDDKDAEVATFLPFGSGMLPTSAGRAARLADIPIQALEQGLNENLFDNEGVLGNRDNKGVPEKFRAWEDIRDEHSLFRAQVLQRRNELARQRRLRVMNERALSTTTDKSLRVEHLVSEMRADLKSLKDRLDYELIELGIDGEQADNLLSAHYKEADKSDFDSHIMDAASPPQRKRREMERTSSPTKQSRRRLEGTDDDLDDTRHSSAKRTRPSQ